MAVGGSEGGSEGVGVGVGAEQSTLYGAQTCPGAVCVTVVCLCTDTRHHTPPFLLVGCLLISLPYAALTYSYDAPPTNLSPSLPTAPCGQQERAQMQICISFTALLGSPLQGPSVLSYCLNVVPSFLGVRE